MIQMLANNTSNIFTGIIIPWLAVIGIILAIHIAIIIAVIKYIAKEIGREVSGNFDYDYMAKMVAYEMKKGTTKVTPKKIEPKEDTEDE